MNRRERIGLVPDNRLLVAFDGFQLTGPLKSWSSPLAPSVLLDCAGTLAMWLSAYRDCLARWSPIQHASRQRSPNFCIDPESKLKFDRTARKASNRALFGLSSTAAGSALAVCDAFDWRIKSSRRNDSPRQAL
jgi:hypothetical protein